MDQGNSNQLQVGNSQKGKGGNFISGWAWGIDYKNSDFLKVLLNNPLNGPQLTHIRNFTTLELVFLTGIKWKKKKADNDVITPITVESSTSESTGNC